jgi:hypothetical protein
VHVRWVARHFIAREASRQRRNGKLASFRSRVIALMKEASNEREPLTHTQAEELVWQQLEEELIHIPPG